MTLDLWVLLLTVQIPKPESLSTQALAAQTSGKTLTMPQPYSFCGRSQKAPPAHSTVAFSIIWKPVYPLAPLY